MQSLYLQIKSPAMQVIPKGIKKERSGQQWPGHISQRMEKDSINHHPDAVAHNCAGNEASQQPSNISQHDGLNIDTQPKGTLLERRQYETMTLLIDKPSR